MVLSITKKLGYENNDDTLFTNVKAFYTVFDYKEMKRYVVVEYKTQKGKRKKRILYESIEAFSLE